MPIVLDGFRPTKRRPRATGRSGAHCCPRVTHRRRFAWMTANMSRPAAIGVPRANASDENGGATKAACCMNIHPTTRHHSNDQPAHRRHSIGSACTRSYRDWRSAGLDSIGRKVACCSTRFDRAPTCILDSAASANTSSASLVTPGAQRKSGCGWQKRSRVCPSSGKRFARGASAGRPRAS